jgi:hypothetical protein
VIAMPAGRPATAALVSAMYRSWMCSASSPRPAMYSRCAGSFTYASDAEPEELAVGGGELFLELADRGSPRVAFAAEFLGEDVHDVAAVRAFRAGFWDRTGSLLVPEPLDAGAEVIGFGAGDGGLPLGLRGLAQRGGAALGGAAGHGASGFG